MSDVVNKPDIPVQVFRIHPEARYVVNFENPIPRSELERVTARLHRWWESGERFLVIGRHVKLERVDE